MSPTLARKEHKVIHKTTLQERDFIYIILLVPLVMCRNIGGILCLQIKTVAIKKQHC
nr:MAG TPA: hypothetical protein [Caudoviricetes sp.]